MIGSDQASGLALGALKDGAAKAGPSGSPWIDTNLIPARGRSVRPYGWVGESSACQHSGYGERYLQAIGDAATAGARWIIALMTISRAVLPERRARFSDWRSITQLLKFYEGHADCIARPAGRLAVVQSAENGASFGRHSDMIGARQ